MDEKFFQACATADLRQVLHQFQKDGYLCDTVLIGENGRVKAHSIVLAATSNVFRSSLKPLSEPVEQVVVLPGLELYVLEIIVHFAYAGVIAVPKRYMSHDHVSKIVAVLMELEFIVASQQNM